MHIDHINIRAPEPVLERVRDFYCSVLGLEEGFRPAFSSRGHWLYSDGSPLIHLSLGGAALDGRPRTHLDHVAFRSTGIEALRTRLEARGVDYRSFYVSELDLSQLFFSDPAGNGVEVNFPGERIE